jgi:hypothetical protein
MGILWIFAGLLEWPEKPFKPDAKDAKIAQKSQKRNANQNTIADNKNCTHF